MSRLIFLYFVAACLCGVVTHGESRTSSDLGKPNIVYILADDLGYGDLQCLNKEGKIPTPHMDRMAREGMRFTDAHSGSSVCTPTRYGILTGRYSWRTPLQDHVLYGYAQALIEPDRLTVGEMLQVQGYTTACIGKWHLGMNWPLKDGGFASEEADGWNVDYTQPIQEGPLDRGFDSYFGISASLDMPPFVFIEGDRATAVPTVEKTWYRTGPAAEDFEAVDVLPRVIERTVEFISQSADQAKSGRPFFLYLPLNAPHTPIVPSKEWEGRSGISAYADFVMQVDDAIGNVLKAIDDAGIGENTLLILTSDNGCAPRADFAELARHGHNPSYHFRGHKADIFEGGHRVPFLVRWPAQVTAGSACDRTVCLTDLMATCAEMLGIDLPSDAGLDSVSFLPALLGKDQPPREATVHHSINGSFAIRQGKWKLALCPDSGGWSEPRPGRRGGDHLPANQLYDLERDIGETENLAKQHPEVVDRLTKLLESYIERGRSTPGPAQENAVPIELRKSPPPAAKDAKQSTAAAAKRRTEKSSDN